MPPRLTITLPASFGNKTVEVLGRRFSIGRTPENDLPIEDSSLSRRHAIVEEVDGRYLISDCGSSNGTFLNGSRIDTETELADWDVLTLGGVGDIVVCLQSDARSEGEQRSAPSGPRAVQVPTKPSRAAPPTNVSTEPVVGKPIIAIVAVVIILIVSGVAILLIKGSGSTTGANVTIKKPRAEDTRDEKRPDTDDRNEDLTATNTNESNAGDNNSSELSTIESFASKVLVGISRDTRPVLTEKPLEQINATVQRYKSSSSLAEQLRTIKREMPQVASVAKSNGLRTQLVVYATLARIDVDGRGDPAQVAASLSPSLARMRAIFGDELANDSLLSVAGLEEGPSLQLKINKLAGRVNDSPATIRSIWYLHDHQTISDQTYNFVLRFLAIGVIVQDPQKFGVAADPLIF